jgi:hypothetical protein
VATGNFALTTRTLLYSAGLIASAAMFSPGGDAFARPGGWRSHSVDHLYISLTPKKRRDANALILAPTK